MVYIIRSINSGRMIEAHDELSFDWAKQKVETHNRLFPLDQWVMVREAL